MPSVLVAPSQSSQRWSPTLHLKNIKVTRQTKEKRVPRHQAQMIKGTKEHGHLGNSKELIWLRGGRERPGLEEWGGGGQIT